jgi:hypothetical protein
MSSCLIGGIGKTSRLWFAVCRLFGAFESLASQDPNSFSQIPVNADPLEVNSKHAGESTYWVTDPKPLHFNMEGLRWQFLVSFSQKQYV